MARVRLSSALLSADRPPGGIRRARARRERDLGPSAYNFVAARLAASRVEIEEEVGDGGRRLVAQPKSRIRSASETFRDHPSPWRVGRRAARRCAVGTP